MAPTHHTRHTFRDTARRRKRRVPRRRGPGSHSSVPPRSATSRTARVRRALRRETPSTVAVVAEEAGFARMRGYPSFLPFGDHRRYLRYVEDLLRSLAAQGVPARVALFDPDDYAAFCDQEGIDPDTPDARARYTAEVATANALPYNGEPLPRLLSHLRGAAQRRRTWETAVTLLVDASPDPVRGPALFQRAVQALAALATAAGPGDHHLVCSVAPRGTSLVATLRLPRTPERAAWLDHPDAEVVCALLAAAFATGGPGGVVLRTTGAGASGGDVLRGWQVAEDWLRPLSEAEIFNAYCTHPATGEPIPPEPGAEYRAGDPLPRPTPRRHEEGP